MNNATKRSQTIRNFSNEMIDEDEKAVRILFLLTSIIVMIISVIIRHAFDTYKKQQEKRRIESQSYFQSLKDLIFPGNKVARAGFFTTFRPKPKAKLSLWFHNTRNKEKDVLDELPYLIALPFRCADAGFEASVTLASIVLTTCLLPVTLPYKFISRNKRF